MILPSVAWILIAQYVIVTITKIIHTSLRTTVAISPLKQLIVSTNFTIRNGTVKN